MEATGVYWIPVYEILEARGFEVLPLVVSDITGVTGLRILRDIVAGHRDPEGLAEHRDLRCRASKRCHTRPWTTLPADPHACARCAASPDTPTPPPRQVARVRMPAFVIAPRRTLGPLEFSDGTSPRYAMSPMRRVLGCCVLVLLSAVTVSAATSELADAAMKRNGDAVRSLLQRKADVNAPQFDGTTTPHWAVRLDDLETADMLIRAGANVSAANRAGAIPMQLAALNGHAAMVEKLIKAGADTNVPLTPSGDTALMMASRTGKTDAIKVLLDGGAKVNTKETWGGTTALMWGGFRAPCGRCQDADRPRRGRQCPFQLRPRSQRPRL
jgi:Ankyrin repeats (3 copies)